MKPTPSAEYERVPTEVSAALANIQVARARQELMMRWILFNATIVLALSAAVPPILHGASVWTAVQSASTGILAWLVRRLFAD